MANPKLENGFAMIAIESLAAICIADLPKYEKVVLAVLLASAYGPAKMAKFRVDHLELADTIGVDPRIVRRAVKGLVAKRVIRQLEGHYYSYVKDWDQWVRDGHDDHDDASPLVGAGERRFIALMTDQFGVSNPSKGRRKVGTNQSPTTDVKGTIESPPTSVKGTIESPGGASPGTGWSPIPSDASSATPCEGSDLRISSSSRAVPPDPLRLIEKKIEERFLTESQINSREDRGAEEHEPFNSEGIAKPLGPLPPVDPSRLSEADRVARLAVERVARAYPGDDSLAECVSIRVASWVRDEGLNGADVEVALIKTIAAGVGAGGLLSYARKVLSGPSPSPGASSFARPSKAQRNARAAAERNAMIDSMFPAKEARDGQR